MLLWLFTMLSLFYDKILYCLFLMINIINVIQKFNFLLCYCEQYLNLIVLTSVFKKKIYVYKFLLILYIYLFVFFVVLLKWMSYMIHKYSIR